MVGLSFLDHLDDAQGVAIWRRGPEWWESGVGWSRSDWCHHAVTQKSWSRQTFVGSYQGKIILLHKNVKILSLTWSAINRKNQISTSPGRGRANEATKPLVKFSCGNCYEWIDRRPMIKNVDAGWPYPYFRGARDLVSTKYVIALIESYLGESPGPRDVMGRANEYMGKRGKGGSE